MKRTKPLTQSITQRIERRNRAVAQARTRIRCLSCGAWLTVQGECRNENCSR